MVPSQDHRTQAKARAQRHVEWSRKEKKNCGNLTNHPLLYLMGPPLWSLALTTLLSRLCMASSPVIVTPQWLHSNLNAVRVLHVGWGNTSADYDMGHVPTAVHFNTDTVPRRTYTNRQMTKPFQTNRWRTDIRDGLCCRCPRCGWRQVPLG